MTIVDRNITPLVLKTGGSDGVCMVVGLQRKQPHRTTPTRLYMQLSYYYYITMNPKKRP